MSDFRIEEEYRALRAEVLAQLRSLRHLDLWIIVGLAACYSWLLSQGAGASGRLRVLWSFLPVVVVQAGIETAWSI